MIVNGKEVFGYQGKSVTDYLCDNGLNVSRIAIEYNGEILPKSQYTKTILKEDDHMEVVCFVGGG